MIQLIPFIILGMLLVFSISSWIRFIKRKDKSKKALKLTISIVSSILTVVVTIVTTYLSTYYKADYSADVSSKVVEVNKIDGGYFYDGPGNNTAMIFYPGAKVDTNAYKPLMTSLAKNGIDCFVADMPFHLAIFNGNIADKFIDNYTYKNWYGSGHSLGGVVMCQYIANHKDTFNGVFLLASYPNNELPENVPVYSIYGTNDGCLDFDAYEQAKKFWPSNSKESIVNGGNHAQFGNYGHQKGDNFADTSSEIQQSQTLNFIISNTKLK